MDRACFDIFDISAFACAFKSAPHDAVAATRRVLKCSQIYNQQQFGSRHKNGKHNDATTSHSSKDSRALHIVRVNRIMRTCTNTERVENTRLSSLQKVMRTILSRIVVGRGGCAELRPNCAVWSGALCAWCGSWRIEALLIRAICRHAAHFICYHPHQHSMYHSLTDVWNGEFGLEIERERERTLYAWCVSSCAHSLVYITYFCPGNLCHEPNAIHRQSSCVLRVKILRVLFAL